MSSNIFLVITRANYLESVRHLAFRRFFKFLLFYFIFIFLTVASATDAIAAHFHASDETNDDEATDDTLDLYETR